MSFDTFIIERDGKEVAKCGGFFSGDPGKSTIQLMENVDVQDGDWIIHEATERKFYAEKVEPIYARGSIRCWVIKYQNESEYKISQKETSSIFNIQNAYGSVIGIENYTTLNYNSTVQELKDKVSADTSSDKEQLEKIVDLLEMVVSDQVPASKGLFSKFSEIMERHSWISNAIAGTILSWLTMKAP